MRLTALAHSAIDATGLRPFDDKAYRRWQVRVSGDLIDEAASTWMWPDDRAGEDRLFGYRVVRDDSLRQHVSFEPRGDA